MRVRFFHSRDRQIETLVAVWVAALGLADCLDPVTHSFRSGTKNLVTWRRTQAFDGDCFFYSVRIDAGIKQRDYPAQRVPYKIDRRSIDDICKGREIEHVFGDAV